MRLDEFKSFQQVKAIFRDFYTALTFLFTFCVKTKSKSLPGSKALTINITECFFIFFCLPQKAQKKTDLLCGRSVLILFYLDPGSKVANYLATAPSLDFLKPSDSPRLMSPINFNLSKSSVFL